MTNTENKVKQQQLEGVKVQDSIRIKIGKINELKVAEENKRLLLDQVQLFERFASENSNLIISSDANNIKPEPIQSMITFGNYISSKIAIMPQNHYYA